MKEKKGSFSSNFAFLMAAVGAAIGLGNIWSFPYKMGANGGFAFLIIYIILAVVIGYPLLLGEIALGRKTRRGAIEAYREVNPRYTIAGVFETLVPFFLLCFYCVLGGIVLKYFIANLGDIFGASFGVGGEKSDVFFGSFIGSPKSTLLFMIIFLVMTLVIVLRGIEGGIERVCSIGMPLLFVMLTFVAIKCCTMPNAIEGVKFMFKPDFTVFRGTGWIRVFATAGAQMFFSLSLASGAIIAYGSYMKDEDNLEKSALIIPILDTIAALLAGLAVFPAVFSEGLPPTAGPGLLFVSLQTVFQSMGSFGPYFGTLFYFLIFVAAFSSSIGMMEGGVSAVMDHFLKTGHHNVRKAVTIAISITSLIGGALVTIDMLGNNTAMWKPFGLGSWLDVFDLFGEGIMMPLGGLLMAFMLGWSNRYVLDDEIRKSSEYKTKPFVDFCWRYLGPLFMAFVVFIQISTFFFSGTEWFQNLLG